MAMPFILELATIEEIGAITGTVTGDGMIKDVLEGWRLIALRGVAPHPGALAVTEAVFGVGSALARGRMICTSSVVMFDADAAMIRTRSGSLYSLGGTATGPLPLPLAWALARHLQ
ncbi:MAG: hypothetical protein HY985_10725 [Magnetospirillum sp.]|nr:hypothetical protein [Magnetospirillum sp.]